MTVKQLIDLLLECPQEQEVVINFEGEELKPIDCDHDSISTTILIG